MGFIKVKSKPLSNGKVQDTYKDGEDTLVVCGDKGALINRKGAKKVTVVVTNNAASISSEVSGFLPAGYLVQDWLNGRN